MTRVSPTLTARRRAFVAFGVLAVTGVLLILCLLLLGRAGGPDDILAGRVVLLAPLGVLLEVVAAQVSFVAGCLALLRAWRLRPEAPAAELALVWTRTTVAVVAGALAALGQAAYALDFAGVMPNWWVALATAPLVCAAVLLLIALAPRTPDATPTQPSLAADLPQLAPLVARLRLDERTWLAPLVVGGLVTLCVLVGTAYAEHSVDEGVVRAVPEALAIAWGYLTLGRRLGLRP